MKSLMPLFFILSSVLSAGIIDDLRKRAEQGDAAAQLLLDTESHWNDLRKRAEQGDIEEVFRFSKEIERIDDYFKRAEQGDAEAQYKLGKLYYRTSAEAVKWWTKAAEQGHAEAQHSLGVLIYDGSKKFVPKDDVEAAKWLRKAAEQGHTAAQTRLSYKYFKGEGVPTDYALSYMWANLAAAQGDHWAKFSILGLPDMMTKEQIAEAQKMTRQWMEKHQKE